MHFLLRKTILLAKNRDHVGLIDPWRPEDVGHKRTGVENSKFSRGFNLSTPPRQLASCPNFNPSPL